MLIQFKMKTILNGMELGMKGGTTKERGGKEAGKSCEEGWSFSKI